MRTIIASIVLLTLISCAADDSDEMIVDDGAPFMIDYIPPSVNGGGFQCEGPDLPGINNCCVTTPGSFYLASEWPYGPCGSSAKCAVVSTTNFPYGPVHCYGTMTPIAGRLYCKC